MFGYVKTHTPELRVAEYEYYRAAYCGLCRSMGKCTGQCSRFTLSYDFAFLFLVRMALSDTEAEIRRRRCIAHPFTKRKMIERCDQLDFCAYAAAILNYHKLLDDISDERGKKRIAARLAKPSVARMRKRALKRGGLASLDKTVDAYLEKLYEIELSQPQSVDIPADVFGELLAEIISYGYDGAERRIAHSIGFHIGRWIYIADALDDLDADIREGKYNPIVCLFGKDVGEEQGKLISDALKNELCDAERSFDLLDFHDNALLRGVVENIIYAGMPRVIEGIQAKRKADRDGDDDNNDRKDHLKSDERSV